MLIITRAVLFLHHEDLASYLRTTQIQLQFVALGIVVRLDAEVACRELIVTGVEPEGSGVGVSRAWVDG